MHGLRWKWRLRGCDAATHRQCRRHRGQPEPPVHGIPSDIFVVYGTPAACGYRREAQITVAGGHVDKTGDRVKFRRLDRTAGGNVAKNIVAEI
jgi:hypothetical protein